MEVRIKLIYIYVYQPPTSSAFAVALFKKGYTSDALNYRPVSLTCILFKVYEMLVREDLLDFLEDKISKHQHEW